MESAPEIYRATPMPGSETGVGVLVLRGSSGAIDRGRVDLFARHGALAEGMRWFGGPGQHPAPYEIALETFGARVTALQEHCDRVILVGTSFGAEAALAAAAHLPGIAAVVAFAPSDVVWAGITPDGRQTSHWTVGDTPLPFVTFVDDWVPATDPPAYRELYALSRTAAGNMVEAATIPVERIATVVLVAGDDDQVWPSSEHARRIAARRSSHGLETTVITHPEAGHYCSLPGEVAAAPGQRMARGGTPQAAAELGRAAWPHVRALLG